MLAVVLLLAACGGPKPQVAGEDQSRDPPDTSNVKINGDASDPVNKLVIQAIADLEEYWGKEMPELYQKDFEPITGGYYAVNPSTDDAPPCAQDGERGCRECVLLLDQGRRRLGRRGSATRACRRSTATSSSRW